MSGIIASEWYREHASGKGGGARDSGADASEAQAAEEIIYE
jgi:hypothetical protein